MITPVVRKRRRRLTIVTPIRRPERHPRCRSDERSARRPTVSPSWTPPYELQASSALGRYRPGGSGSSRRGLQSWSSWSPPRIGLTLASRVEAGIRTSAHSVNRPHIQQIPSDRQVFDLLRVSMSRQLRLGVGHASDRLAVRSERLGRKFALRQDTQNMGNWETPGHHRHWGSDLVGRRSSYVASRSDRCPSATICGIP